jgi:VWFA-related protein
MRPALLLPLVFAPLGAQILLNPPREPSVITVDVDLVNVLCTVRDRHGGFVKGLAKEDFEVREEGRPREIGHFAREVDSPMTVALLLDVSGSVSNILDTEKAAGAGFFKEVLRPGDKALLVGFAQMIAVWQDFTGEARMLEAALEKASPFPAFVSPNAESRPRGGTLLYDAVQLTANRKLRRQPGRKTIILITDGLDNGSMNPLENAARAAQEADAVIYAIHYQDSGSYRQDGEGVLKRLSEPTGGRTFHISGKAPLEAAFDAIREEMRSQYSIGFKPANGEMDGAWRRLEIKARPGQKVQARAGYFAVRK